MDNAMVKRGIGAVVLAIIAALLLGYLLKDKSRERQEVVEMSLPGTASDKIPSLSDTAENTGSALADGASNLAENTADGIKNAGATVVAAAAGAGAVATAATNKAADTAATTAGQAVASTATATGNLARPGFSIRPAAPNEQREIVDPNAGSATASASSNKRSTTANTNSQRSASNKPQNKAQNKKVVASSSGATKEAYRPRLIKERKTRIVSSSQGSRQALNRNSRPAPRAITPTKRNQAKRTQAKPAATSTVSKGGYAIQLMATASESRAKKLAKTMKNEGYHSYITRTTRNNKVLFRVRVRAGASRDSALASQKKMKRRYQKNFFVQNSLVVSN